MTNARVTTIAERITNDLHPATVAVLLRAREESALVSALRQRNIRAWGLVMDESLDAIESTIREYCFLVAPFDLLPRRYDLIVCLGALAHLPQLDVERSIANLCAHAEDVLFSPTRPRLHAPLSSEASQAHSAEHWAAVFARRNFFHQVYFDATFADSNAMCFRKLHGSIAGVVHDYEQRQRELTELVAALQRGRAMRALRRVDALRRRFGPGGRVASARGAEARGRGESQTRTYDPNYADWIAANEPSADELERQRQHRFDYAPRLSIITPVFNPPPYALREAIESVCRQTYSNWEWCLADGGSDVPEVRAILEEAAANDERIRVNFLPANLGISGNSNQALRLATGEFVLLFDHDDRLAPFALHEIVRTLNDDPNLDIVCFDEDKITADSAMRLQPMFKPARWSPETMLSANYLMHAAIRRSLIEQVGGFDSASDGAQDWDVLLRCSEQTSHIGHVAKVLYHWRMLPNSAAVGVAAGKPWAIEVQPRVVVNHLKRLGIADASFKLHTPGVFQLVWPVRHDKISIIIPTKAQAGLLRRCVQSLLSLTASGYSNFEVIIVDTGSTDRRALDYYAELGGAPRVRMLRFDAPFNYSAVNNFGVQHATGAHLLFLNNDIEAIEAGWLEEMLRWSQRPEIGAVGAKLLYPEGTIQHAGIVIGMGHVFAGAPEDRADSSLWGGPNAYRNVSAVTGACMMMRRDVFDQMGGFNEDYALAFSDVELCLRITQKGYRIVYTPFARLRHEEGATRANYVPDTDHTLADQHLRTVIEQGDPFFNPNLSLASRTPKLRLPDEV